jgi:RNA polymerase sigma factor (sigma-70 family)
MVRTFEKFERKLWPVLGALARRGYVAQPADANDIIHDFFVDEWPLVEKHYDPSRGPFERYLFAAFYRFGRRRIARAHSQQRRMVEMSSALSLSSADTPAEELVEAGARAAEMREALARLPDTQRVVLQNYLSDASGNEREMARQLGITRYRLRETMADAMGRLATELNTLEPEDALDRRVATALWRDGKGVSETAAELGLSIPEVHVVRKRTVQHLLDALRDPAARKTSRRKVMFSSEKNPPKEPLDLLKLALLSKGNSALLGEVKRRAAEILESLDLEDQEFSASEREVIQDDPEWMALVYEALGAEKDESSDDEDQVEASIGLVLGDEEREIGEAFSELTENLSPHMRNWPELFRQVPRIPERAHALLDAKWQARGAGRWASGLIYYGITPATVFEATVGISLLLDRCSAEANRGHLHQFALVLGSERLVPDEAIRIGDELLLAQMRATPDCPPEAAAPLLRWLFRVSAHVPHLFEGYRVQNATEHCLRIVSEPTQYRIDLVKRWSGLSSLGAQRLAAYASDR